jgi:tRNA uridine 5-carboxymethylaminomethyl modification enzyme
MYFGIVKSMGARYCPSIEDKIMRFPDREIHQVFIEPEGRDTNEVYVQGLSTSLPPDVQIELYRSVIGLEHCEIVRPGYAIEYDCIDATVLKPSLEFKYISNLFSAGQLNGTSGYEEAAAQGIIAGINAVLKIRGQEPLILNRSDAYIGVLIDDIVIKGTSEPYRMMTSRAEYRLLLRQDNADMRLTDIGANIGLISCDRYNRFLQKRMNIEQEIIRVKKTNIRPNSIVNAILAELNSSPIDNVYKLDELIKRPELNYQNLSGIDLDRPDVLNDEEKEQVNIQIKYEGYLKKQEQSIEHFRKIENKKIPENINYVSIKGLSKEAVQKLTNIKPLNFGQASRITGVSPADILVLQVYLKKCSRIGSISID